MGTVERLPDPFQVPGCPESALATGTDCGTISKRFAEYLPRTEDGIGQDSSATAGLAGIENPVPKIHNPGEGQDLPPGFGSMHEESEARPVGFEPTTLGFEVRDQSAGSTISSKRLRIRKPAVADDHFARDVFVRRRLRDDGRLAHEPGHLEGLADHAVQFLQIDRLEQVVVGPVPHRLDGRVSRPDHGDEHDRNPGVDLSELRQDIQSRLVWQAQVEENDIRARGGGPFQAVCTRVGDLDPMFGRGEHVGYLVVEEVRVVIDQEQEGH